MAVGGGCITHDLPAFVLVKMAPWPTATHRAITTQAVAIIGGVPAGTLSFCQVDPPSKVVPMTP
jgi:hypothetical protein